MRTTKKTTIVFDFDGTLVDVEPIFLKIFNRLAPEFGYAPLLPSEIADAKKLHLRRFIWKRLGLRLFLFPRILRRGREEYHALISEATLFPGIKDLLEALRVHGYHVGVVSSGRKDTILKILERFDITMDFVCQSGLFNKSKTLRKLLAEQNIPRERALYIGDEVRDIESCRRIGLDIIAVTWGLNDKSTLEGTGTETVDNPEELRNILLTDVAA